VIVGNGAEKRIVTKKVWESRTRKQQLGTDFIFDGNKLAW
jgi:eukaryotic translation initiation factor 2C